MLQIHVARDIPQPANTEQSAHLLSLPMAKRAPYRFEELHSDPGSDYTSNIVKCLTGWFGMMQVMRIVNYTNRSLMHQSKAHATR